MPAYGGTAPLPVLAHGLAHPLPDLPARSAKELAALGEFDENGLYAVEVLASLAVPPAARTVSGTGGDRA